MKFGKVVLLVVTAAVAVALTVTLVSGQAKLTRENWGKSVGFAFDASKAPPAGTTVNSANMGQYAAMIPNGVQTLMKKYGYKFTTKDYEAFAPSNGYIDATNKGAGQPKYVKGTPRELGLQNYVAGLPFPTPKDGTEVAYNYIYSYVGDDADNLFSVHWIGAKSGREKSEEWQWKYITRGVNRTDIAPIPAFESAKKSGTQYYSLTITKAPADKAGLATLYTRMVKPEDQKGFLFNPVQQKIIPMVFGTVGTSWNNTDMLYEDVRGYMGYAEWMSWEILEKKTMLLPMNSGVPHGKAQLEQVYDFQNAPHWNFKSKWEPRPVYVLQAKSKFNDYPYSKMIFYVDAESYYFVVKDAYDKKGQLWKVLINAWNRSKNPASEPPSIGTSLVVDLQEEHATAFGWYTAKSNVGLQPEAFTQAALSKAGK
jgi:hypothetical protein